MTSNALAILQTLFQTIWTFLTTWYIPGTHTTPAGWGMFALFLSLVFRFASRIFLTATETFNEKL